MASDRKTRETFQAFVAAINRRDVSSIAARMAEDHLFVDSLGNHVQGRATMEKGWRGYFTMCPDYSIRVDDVLVSEETVMAAGDAGGTIDGESWRVPAAWKAVIREGMVLEWRVFADNKPVCEILARRKQQ